MMLSKCRAHSEGRFTGFLLLVMMLAGPAVSRSGAQSPRIAKADGPRYARSFRATDGTIYLLGPLKTKDAGKKLALCNPSDPPWGTLLNEGAMNTIYAEKGLFFALQDKVVCASNGQCTGKMWRSTDDLKSFQDIETRVIIPEAGKVDNGSHGEWAGLVFHRAIVDLRDGSLLAAMYGNFEHDTITPTNPRSKLESKYKLRAFTVRSTDQGLTWRYLSTVVAPEPAVVDDSEGFNEWSIARLADARLLGIIRTGHYTPLVASWSSDEGKTWTKAVTPSGLGPGCDPYVIRLSDGRLALAYGQLPPPQGPREAYWKNYSIGADERRCLLAIDTDGSGRNWVTSTVSDYARNSAYATIFEVEPGTIVYQADLSVWRVELPPK
jgi:hypothetical protein